MSIEKLDFQKVTKENLPYTLILTKVIQNIKHKDALAIWVYLSSLPPDWKINKEHLKLHFHVGDRTLQAIFSYLNRSNLITYKRERFEDGTLGIVIVHVLCGDEFKFDEPYVLTTPQKTHVVVDLTTPQKTTRVANHTSGSEALQKKQDNKRKRTAFTNKTKSSYENAKKHAFAESMDQMATESKHIKEHEARKAIEKGNDKRTGMPQEIKSLLGIKPK